MMQMTRDTLLRDILAAYPWLKEEAIRRDSRFRAADTMVGRMLLKKATIADAAKYTGLTEEAVIREIENVIREHENA